MNIGIFLLAGPLIPRSTSLQGLPKSSILFEDLIGSAEQGDWHLEAECPGCLQVDNKFDFRDLLYRQISRLLAVEDAAGIDANQAIQFIDTASVAHQTACHHELSIRRYRRH